MGNVKIKTWYGIDDQFHISVKIGNNEYAVAGSQCPTDLQIKTLIDLILHSEFGFDSTDLFHKAFNSTLVQHKESTEHGFPTETERC